MFFHYIKILCQYPPSFSLVILFSKKFIYIFKCCCFMKFKGLKGTAWTIYRILSSFNFSSGEDDLFPFPPVVGINEYKLPFVITKMLSGGWAMAWWRIPSAWLLKSQGLAVSIVKRQCCYCLSATVPGRHLVVFIWSSRMSFFTSGHTNCLCFKFIH